MTKYSFSCLNHHKTAAYLHFLFLVAVSRLNETFVRSGPSLFASFRVIGGPLSTPPATILPLSHDTLLLAIIRLIICFLYHLKNYILIVIQLERLVRHSSSTEETHWSLQVLTEEMKCNPTSFFLISIILYFRFYFIIIIFSVFLTHHVQAW